ncbi:LGFP repeat-containing protein [Yinghuangia sp. YIM S10712]|uniref:LGFP repeat-containing protein n=1 Tax=Yinghuangia sp. YIM S10712 TaxID=3436930 RepID=UPI003F537A25
MSTYAARPLRRLAAAVAVTSLVALAGTAATARAAPLSPTSTSAQISATAAPAPNDPKSPAAAGETAAATPDVTAETLPDNRAVVYLSWDDTTDFTQWRVLAGSGQESLRALATVPRTGSRTAVPVAYTDDDILVRVEALDATGAVVASADRSGLFPLAAAYARAGGAATLGAFVSRSEESGAVTVVYQRGSVQWSAPTGAHPITGRIWNYAKTRRHSIGLPTSDAALLPDGRGTAQGFAAGRVYINPQGGVHSVLYYFLYEYEETGAERGPLGYPTSDRDESTRPSHQRFDNGKARSATAGRPSAGNAARSATRSPTN